MLDYLLLGTVMESDLKKLLWKTLLGIVILVVLIGILSHFLKGPITQFSGWFIEYLGVYGVGLGILISDALPAFMIPDAFLVFAVAGKLDDFPVIFYSCVGSMIGGSISYLLGMYVFPKMEFAKNFIDRHEENLKPYVEKYGVWAVVLAATTPLPYSWMAILVGTLKMPYREFIAASLARIPRFVFYYYAIKLGWVVS